MSGTADPLVFKNALVLLTSAGIAVPLLLKLRINSIISFLLLGMTLGPHGLGTLVDAYPQLQTIVVNRSEGLTLLGDLGVVFLLFLIGMELSIQRLVTMRRFVFGMGALQLIACAFCFSVLGGALGLSQKAAILIGTAFALSSTAIVIQFLSRKKQLNSLTGRACFSILLFQDLAIIPVLFLLTILDKPEQNNLLVDFALALGQAVLIVVGIYAAGRLLARPLFRLVASTESADLFVATTLLVVIGSAFISSVAGASMSLGAFIAGLLIAETEYSRAIGAVVEPFKGILLGLFFFTVGMGIDIGYVAQNLVLVAGLVVALIAIKAIIIVPIVRVFGFFWSTSVKTALLLGPAGEFAFVVIGLAGASGILSPYESGLAVAVASLSMSAIPLMGKMGLVIAKRMNKTAPARQIFPQSEESKQVEALVIGLRRVGTMACEMLNKHKVRFIAIDLDPTLVDSLRAKGMPAYYGNAADPLFLEQCGIANAKSVVITSHSRDEIDAVVNTVRLIRKDVRIISRAHDADHATHLYKKGVSVAVPETIEASLQLSEAALLSLNWDKLQTIASVNEERDRINAQLKQTVAEA
jgi:CPA2 family monovalent cation:H+ antiporter-2